MDLLKKPMQAAGKLAAFAKLERIIAVICIAIPALLALQDTGTLRKFRSSISNYVYMDAGHVYGMLLTIAAMLFIFNGVIYFKDDAKGECRNKHGRWYNVILGLAILGVIIFPHQEYKIIHHIFAALFFLGSTLTMIFFNDKHYKKLNYFFALLSTLGLMLYFYDKEILSLFWAEWFSLIAIAGHYLMVSLVKHSVHAHQ